jgi:uncharacterized protein YdbL (DUF1318 family)
MKTSFFRYFPLLVALVLGAAVLPARAEDLGAVKARMSKRISRIDALKEKGAVGENNRGYLEKRENVPGVDEVVAQENKDRATVYEAIAKQTGSTADSVGRQRARQLATASAPGVWIQKENDTWYRK